MAPAISFASDPLGFIAKACAEATTWVWTELAKAVNATTQVDFTSAGFLQEYALVFAVSTVLVVLLWLVAVGKRAVRGVGIGQALGESIGFLGLAVVASAFAPALLVLLMGLVDAATSGLSSGIGANATTFMAGADKAMLAALASSGTGPVSGGPVVIIAAAVVGLVVGLVVWTELLLAAAGLLVAAVFGPLVFAGLVDRSKWGHTHKWCGVVVALALVKPVLVTVLGLAAGLAANGGPADSFSSVLEAIALLLLSVFSSFAVYALVPIVGGELAQLHWARKAAQTVGPLAAIPGPATIISNGIAAHLRGGGRGSSAPAQRTPAPGPTVPQAASSPHARPPSPPPAAPSTTPVPAGATPGVP